MTTHNHLFGHWDMIPKIAHLPVKMLKFEQEIGIKVAKFAIKEIAANIRQGGKRYGAGFAPNTPATLKGKSGDTPLIDTGNLIKALGYKDMGAGVVWIGIKEGMPIGDKGKTVDEIAMALHEGFVINHKGGSTTIVPGRPFIRDVVESKEFVSKVEKLVESELAKVFKL